MSYYQHAEDTVQVPRAQHEALMAAAKALAKVYGDAGGKEWNEAFRALTALRAAGIDLESKT